MPIPNMASALTPRSARGGCRTAGAPSSRPVPNGPLEGAISACSALRAVAIVAPRTSVALDACARPRKVNVLHTSLRHARRTMRAFNDIWHERAQTRRRSTSAARRGSTHAALHGTQRPVTRPQPPRTSQRRVTAPGTRHPAPGTRQTFARARLTQPACPTSPPRPAPYPVYIQPRPIPPTPARVTDHRTMGIPAHHVAGASTPTPRASAQRPSETPPLHRDTMRGVVSRPDRGVSRRTRRDEARRTGRTTDT